MIKNKKKMIKYSFDDILLLASPVSKINSRLDVDPFYENGLLPIFTAPMLDIISSKNYLYFLKNGINPILPRTKDNNTALNNILTYGDKIFISLSLDQFIHYFNNDISVIDESKKYHILIDIANGHMSKLLESIKIGKTKYPNLIVMMGNISNPEILTYMFNNKIYPDYIRFGVGNGGNCTTTNSTGIGYSQFALIEDSYNKLNELNWIENRPKIISDGGHKSFSDIIKALAVGADYCMIGGLFSNLVESSGRNYLFKKIKISNKLASKLYKIFPIYKKYRGMSTKSAQKEIGKGKLKTEEGIITYNKINSTLEIWATIFEDYLRSSMSYLNVLYLNEFIGKTKYTIISETAVKRLKK